MSIIRLNQVITPFKDPMRNSLLNHFATVITGKYGGAKAIAVGGVSFVETIQQRLGLRAKGRKVKEAGESFQLREDVQMYIADYDFRNCNIERCSTFLVGDNSVDTDL